MIHFLLCWSFGMEPRLSISDLFENWYLYVRAKYKTISEQNQGAKKYISYYRICVFKIFGFIVVNQCKILAYLNCMLVFFKIYYTFKCYITNCYIFIDYDLTNLFTQHVSFVDYVQVRWKNTVLMEVNLEFASKLISNRNLRKFMAWLPDIAQKLFFTWYKDINLHFLMNYEWIF